MPIIYKPKYKENRETEPNFRLKPNAQAYVQQKIAVRCLHGKAGFAVHWQKVAR